jgi:hypothetical protein
MMLATTRHGGGDVSGSRPWHFATMFVVQREAHVKEISRNRNKSVKIRDYYLLSYPHVNARPIPVS